MYRPGYCGRRRVDFQRGGQIVHLGGEQQRAVVQDPVVPDALRRSGELPSVDGEVVAALELCWHPHLIQCLDDRFGKGAEVTRTFSPDEGVVHVPEVVEDRPAARLPSHHVNMVTVNVFLVDFGGRVLMPAHHDGVVVLPQHENVVLRLLQQVLLRREVVVGGGGV